MKMHFHLGSVLARFSVIGSVWSLNAAGSKEMKNVAIIGAGAAGSSAAYHLQCYAASESLPINITIFEKTTHIGGRTLTANAYNSPLEPIELGASIFVTINHILYNATQRFDLPLGSMTRAEEGDLTAIWDGEMGRFVYETYEGGAWWRDAVRMVWRYGASPYWAVRLVRGTVARFLRIYEEPWFPFESLTERVHELGLEKITGVTGEQFLAENKINPDFCRHIIQAATRVNYASNLAHIHGLEAMVSFSTEGAVAVSGGNWQIFDNMVHHSGAALHRNTTVTSLSFAGKGERSGAKPRYTISTRESGADAQTAVESPVAFDSIIIASPWQFSDIAADDGILNQGIDEIPYAKLHVTLFTSPFKLRPGFFGLEPGSRAPSNVYTTLKPGEEARPGAEGVGSTGFYSISTLRSVINPETSRLEYAYKIFSAEAVTPAFLSDLLGARVPAGFTRAAEETERNSSPAEEGKGASVDTISWFLAHWFHAYPVELPRVTFQDPVVGEGVYYTSGMESFISTMETSALMGMNVARLIADDVAGIRRGGEKKEKGGENESGKGRTFGDGEL